jgi:hypothetical protein
LVASGIVMTTALDVLRRQTAHLAPHDRESMHISLVFAHSFLQLLLTAPAGAHSPVMPSFAHSMWSLGVAYAFVTTIHVGVQAANLGGVANLLAKCSVPVLMAVVFAPRALRVRQWVAVLLLVTTTAHACYAAALATNDTLGSTILQLASVGASMELVRQQRLVTTYWQMQQLPPIKKTKQPPLLLHTPQLVDMWMTRYMHATAILFAVIIAVIQHTTLAWLWLVPHPALLCALGYTLSQIVCSQSIQTLASRHDSLSVHFAQSLRKSLSALVLVALAWNDTASATNVLHCIVAFVAIGLYES